MSRRPIILLLCSVILAAISVLGAAAFTPIKDGSNPPAWQAVLYFCFLGIFALSILVAIASVIWLLVTKIRKPN